MNLLLDTHAFIWFADQQQSAKLPSATKLILADRRNTLFLSFASIWETAIKVSIGKLQLSDPIADLVRLQQTHNGIQLLPFTLAQIELVERMPFHHNDPFDRLLIAQAQAENLTLVSIDAAFDAYGVTRLWLT